ncbi:GntR family transcriptional regulator [Spirosoma endbachense]|uniref:GntR family transcriptional regulator n=1 Tax=Spirosoma endbachense TaxID=2666025 RepID=A0A6P1W6M8_9BACT|nr:GntR family transcriptional regulator [Spirosoma endbachense]QHV99689.1 GntR family transcriptional regulator [Spirosoma endbachense]
MLRHIKINDYSNTPKYQQIYNSIVEGIENRDIIPGDKLPSIHELCAEFDVAKGTIERAYELLKEKEIIEAVRGKGFYINYTKTGQNLKIFLLFNKLSAHKKIIYDSFVELLGPGVAIDFFIYNNDFRLFRDLIERQARNHTHYVIIGHFYEGGEKANELINSLPKHKLILLDKLLEGVSGKYAAVFQNFEKDLYQALTDALPLLKKYTTLCILFPSYTYHPKAILNGFYKFCYEHNFNTRVIDNIQQEVIYPQQAYINLMEDDLVELIKKIKMTTYIVGQEVGILSYNETPLKEFLLEGITVMSTDFAQMGRTAAQLVLNTSVEHIENPFQLIVRKSL